FRDHPRRESPEHDPGPDAAHRRHHEAEPRQPLRRRLMATDDPGFSEEHEQVMAALIDAILPASDDGRMPGAAALDLVSHVERSARQNPMLRPVIEYGLSSIAELVTKRNPAGIDGLPTTEWAAALREFAATDQFFLPAFLFLVYGGYYQH